MNKIPIIIQIRRFDFIFAPSNGPIFKKLCGLLGVWVQELGDAPWSIDLLTNFADSWLLVFRDNIRRNYRASQHGVKEMVAVLHLKLVIRAWHPLGRSNKIHWDRTGTRCNRIKIWIDTPKLMGHYFFFWTKGLKICKKKKNPQSFRGNCPWTPIKALHWTGGSVGF